MLEYYAAFLRWLASHGISPELPLILTSMAMGWLLHTEFVYFQNKRGARKCKKLIAKNTRTKS